MIKYKYLCLFSAVSLWFKMKYSSEFKDLISYNPQLVRFSEDDTGRDLSIWEEERMFLKQLFDKDGSIIDIGCSNGFFIRWLKEITRKDLEPYGIDRHQESILEASLVFPGKEKHFIVADMFGILDNIKGILKAYSLPLSYDFVFHCFLEGINPDMYGGLIRIIYYLP